MSSVLPSVFDPSRGYRRDVATPGDLPAVGLPDEIRKVHDDGDGNPALYGWNPQTLAWNKIADPDSSGLVSPVPIADGGTAATNEANARTNLILGTADAVRFGSLALGGAPPVDILALYAVATLATDGEAGVGFAASIGDHNRADVQRATMTRSAGLGTSGDRASCYGAIPATHAGDVAGTEVHAYSALSPTDAGGGQRLVAYGGATGYEVALLALSGKFEFQGYEATLQGVQSKDIDQDGFDLNIVAMDGFDSGAAPRDGGNLNLDGGAAVNGGIDGRVATKSLINLSTRTPTVEGDLSRSPGDGHVYSYNSTIGGPDRVNYFTNMMGRRKCSWSKEPGPGVLVMKDQINLGPLEVGTPTRVASPGGDRVVYTSTGAGVSAGWDGADDAGAVYNVFQSQFRGWIVVFEWQTSADITTARSFYGMFSASPMGSDTPALHYFGVRKAAGDANWRFVTDNGSGTPTDVDTTLAAAASTNWLLLVMSFVPGILECRLTNKNLATSSSETMISTTLPGDATDLGPVMAIRGSAGAKATAPGLWRLMYL